MAEITSFFEPPPPFSQVNHTTDTESLFSLTFEIAAACDYTLTGSVATSGVINSLSQSRITLSGPGSVVIAEVEVVSDPDCVDPGCIDVGPVPLDESGTLGPGVYMLEAVASGTA